MSKLKWVAAALLLLVVVGASAYALGVSHQREYQRGYADGFHDGLKQGFTMGADNPIPPSPDP